MDVLNFLFHYIGNIFTTMFTFVCWNNCLRQKTDLSNKKNFLLLLLTSLIITCLNLLLMQPFRVIMVFVFGTLICYLFFIKSMKRSLLLVINSQLIIMIVEVILYVVFSIIYKDKVDEYLVKPIIFLIFSAILSIVSIIVLKVNFQKKLYNLMVKSTNAINNNETLKSSCIIILIIIISQAESYMKLPLSIVLITNILLGIIFIGITIKNSYIKTSYNRINKKYQISINSLKEYEIMIDKYRVNNHENKNEFLTIRNMIKNKDSKTIEYIDKLIDNKIKDNEKIMKQTQKIPEGGLRATIYSKLCVMDKYKIKYNLDIAKDVKTVDLINLDEELILNICKILGVFLDNAIEEVQKLKKKNIDIEIYVMDGKLCIDITNNYNGKIDLNKIDMEKYTTKGKGHGYGLSLVNQIIVENSQYLENEKNINGNKFTQILKIKM